MMHVIQIRQLSTPSQKLGCQIPSIFCTGYLRDDPQNHENFVKIKSDPEFLRNENYFFQVPFKGGPDAKIFTALHGMQRGLTMRFLSVCPSVRPSVCLSVCQTRALWQNGRKICRDFYAMRKIILSSFMRRRMVGGGWPLLSEILGQPARVGAKSPILNQ